MKKTFALGTISTLVFLALTSFAQAQASAAGIQGGMGTFADIIKTFNETVVKALGTLIMSGAVVAFFYGLAHFIWGLREGDPKVITNGKQFMFWSLVALFVMFSVYGIIKFFQSNLLPGATYNITIPEVNYGGSGGTGASSQTKPFTCPDGVTTYFDPSQASVVCKSKAGGLGQPCNTSFGVPGSYDSSGVCQPN
jgi:succinate dehydrogenase/fumarate reductase cytochrome b subunit